MGMDSEPAESSGVEVNTINLKLLEDQIKASGDDSLETKEMLNCMHKFDKNNNGTMEAMELMAMVKDNVEVNRSKTRLTGWLQVSAALIVLLTLIMSGLVVGVVAAFKDSYVKGDSTMSDGKGHVVKVTSAKIGLPLYVAAVMDGERLAAIEKVRVKTSNGPDETEIEHFLKVETVRRFNDTALVFLMANNQALFVWNGETFYVDANDTMYPVCEATATCAALYVDDHDETKQLEEKAIAALEAGGFIEAAGRRRLGRDTQPDICILLTDGRPMSMRRTRVAAESLRRQARLMWVPVTRWKPTSSPP